VTPSVRHARVAVAVHNALGHLALAGLSNPSDAAAAVCCLLPVPEQTERQSRRGVQLAVLLCIDLAVQQGQDAYTVR
jgi:hypothetical protein